MMAAESYYMDKKQISATYSNSCGPLVRLAPLSLIRGLDDAFPIGDFYASQTHSGPDTRLATCIVASLIKFMYHQTSFSFQELSKTICETRSAIQEYYQPQIKVFDASLRLFDEKYTKLLSTIESGQFEYVLSFGGTSDAYDVLFTALGILFLSKGEFKDTAYLVSLIGGDADSVGALACSLSGLLRGINDIPNKYRQQFLDSTLQYGEDEIVTFVKKFFTKATEYNESTHRYEESFALTDTIRKEVKTINAKIERSPEGYITHGQVVTSSRSSFVSLLRELNKQDDIITTDSGLLCISEKSIKRHPLCITQYIHRARNGDSKKCEEKVSKITKVIAAHLKKVKDENEKWRLNNILEIINTEQASHVLLKQHSLGVEKSKSIKRNAVLSCLFKIVNEIRNPANIPEELYHNTVFIVSDFGVREFMQKNRTLITNRLRPQTKSIGDLTNVGHTGGIYLISANGGVCGPLLLEKQTIFDLSHKCFGSLPVPARDMPLVSICQKNSAQSVLVYPRRNCVVFLDGAIPACFSRIYGQPETFREVDLRKYRTECQDKWDKIIKSSGFSAKLIYIAVSLVMEVVAQSNHGCSICLLKNANDFIGGRKNEKWFNPILKLDKIKTLDDVSTICDYLTEDGGVVVDAAQNAIVAYGQKFSPDIKDAIDLLPSSTKDYIETRGMRHKFGAWYAAQLKGKGAVVVGSQRGDITIFSNKEPVSLLPSSN